MIADLINYETAAWVICTALAVATLIAWNLWKARK